MAKEARRLAPDLPQAHFAMASFIIMWSARLSEFAIARRGLLGFSEVQLQQWLEEAGFGKIEVTVVSREKESPHFQTVFATRMK